LPIPAEDTAFIQIDWIFVLLKKIVDFILRFLYNYYDMVKSSQLRQLAPLDVMTLKIIWKICDSFYF